MASHYRIRLMSRKKKEDFLDMYEPAPKKVIIEEQDRRIEHLEDYVKQLEADLDKAEEYKLKTRKIIQENKKLKKRCNRLVELAWKFRDIVKFYAEEQNYSKSVKVDGRWWYPVLNDKGKQAKTALTFVIGVKRPSEDR